MVKFQTGVNGTLYVNGILDLQGTAANPVVFTSDRDDPMAVIQMVTVQPPYLPLVSGDTSFLATPTISSNIPLSAMAAMMAATIL